jgi:hypothetical protein
VAARETLSHLQEIFGAAKAKRQIAPHEMNPVVN